MKKSYQPLAASNARDPLTISLRAFVPPPEASKSARKSKKSPASEYTLVFDCETTTELSHQLRFGAYQVYKGRALIQAGVFIDPDTLTKDEHVLLKRYAISRQLRFLTKEQFVEDVFYGTGYDLRATIVGFNLPFDLSRLAIRHSTAKGKTMRGGFSLQLSANRWRPRVQIKHLSARAALIQFTKPRHRNDSRGMRKRGQKTTERRGAFIDVKTLAAAHTSRSFSLGGLADYLETESRKHSTDEHGGPLTDTYITYAVQDVQVTWECYRKLLAKFDAHGFTRTRASQILSEASIGKACLREMGILPWREVQPDFPDELTGIIMSTYYGGRSEMHWRRVINQVLYCDFLSMYPTVCTLMGLWKFVIAKGVKWQDVTAETTEFLERVTLADFQQPSTWSALPVLIQVVPHDDIFPVRAKYDASLQATIGANHLSGKAQWFTLADCIASQVLTGKTPKIVRAVTFEPADPQDDLKPISLAGNAGYLIDPRSDDFYRELINLRNRVKSKLKASTGQAAALLDTEQLALKILANSTSYGIFVEFIVEALADPENRTCYGGTGEPFTTPISKAENPGPYFHPLIATLITGAARLMLAIAERLAIDTGLDWAFCDTDSMALAKPDGVDQDAFFQKARSVCEWFTPLNPYEHKGPLFKIEDANFSLAGDDPTGTLAPLFFLGVSAKRYVLFNLTPDGRPIVRKASAHGLGHLLPPYGEDNPPPGIPAPKVPLETIGVERWQYDLWYQIILAALAGHPDQVRLDYHPALDQPAASRYAATTPELLGWFKGYNRNRAYRDQVRPFGFLLAFQALPNALSQGEVFELEPHAARKKGPRPKGTPLRPIAPYSRDIRRAANNCFDRETDKPVEASLIKTYRMALARYHLSPESKFLNGEPYDRGATQRRLVEAIAINCIGKEANRWEEQYYLGLDIDAQIDYGMCPEGSGQFQSVVESVARLISQREIAKRAGISRATLSKLMKGKPVRNAELMIRSVLAVITGAKRNVLS
jgi:hypothetical protein